MVLARERVGRRPPPATQGHTVCQKSEPSIPGAPWARSPPSHGAAPLACAPSPPWEGDTRSVTQGGMPR